MNRREFTLLGGAAVTWPLAAGAQQTAKKMLRVGTVSGTQQSSPQWTAFLQRTVSGTQQSSPQWTAFLQRMAELGYQEGKTFAFDFVPAANEEEYETGYRTLAARKPDIIMVILAVGLGGARGQC